MTIETMTSELRLARRSLDGLRGFERIGEFTWDAQISRWYFKFSLTTKGSELVPSTSEWFAFVEREYPWGEIKVRPAVACSITTTFPHMSFNGEAENGRAWRKSSLCLDTTVSSLNRNLINDEDFSASARLKWHIKRALRWTELASENRLLDTGEPFELPVFPKSHSDKRVYVTSESQESFQDWKNYFGCFGLFKGLSLRPGPYNKITEHRVVFEFCSADGNSIRLNSWGGLINRFKNSSRKPKNQEMGIWILLPFLPIKVAWEVPTTWEELWKVCEKGNIDLESIFRTLMPYIQDGEPHVVLFGMPIPENVSEPTKLIHWQAIALPKFDNSNKHINGYRQGGKAEADFRLKNNLRKIAKSPIAYLTSENWHHREISSRGRLAESITDQKIAILGAGAFGSLFTEQLARCGAKSILVFDNDDLAVGNLTRHSLLLSDVGLPKSLLLASSIEKANPHTRAHGFAQNFPPVAAHDIAKVRNCDIIIDCTASDELLFSIEKFDWGERIRFFFSFSLGLGGKRMFAYGIKSEHFPVENFRLKLHPWLLYELEKNDREYPREGTGCWHSVFPARIDDVQLMVSSAVKFIEEKIISNEETDHFVAFEQIFEDGKFQGIRRCTDTPNTQK